MKKTVVSISHAELNTIIDALQYAVEQTKTSAGDIQAFCRDGGPMLPEDNIAMAGVAEGLADQFLEVFKEGSVDFIIDVNDSSPSGVKQKLPLNKMLIARGFRYNGKRANVSSWSRKDVTIRRVINMGKPFVTLKFTALNEKYIGGCKFYTDDPALRTAIMSDFVEIPEPTEEVKWNEH